jgi:hypothetical protein
MEANSTLAPKKYATEIVVIVPKIL